jgi:hypothetical protein
MLKIKFDELLALFDAYRARYGFLPSQERTPQAP